MRFAYPIELERMTEEDGGIWLVTFPDWNNAVTDDEDVPEAMANARDYREELLACSIGRRLPIPAPGPPGNRAPVEPEAGLALEAALWHALHEQGATGGELARRLIARPELIRRALAALGKRVVVELEDAA
ncbi:type II toxin-antitoxin system HicB family antitoxin [Benzoatithermus flavus]|uniref:Type II toxin-antitoxin system HicB family antitoxin n=1 Tax=Benzoatithermus flavus TaxID=3108223 RepID=A0ABU8XTL1_9PROT